MLSLRPRPQAAGPSFSLFHELKAGKWGLGTKLVSNNYSQDYISLCRVGSTYNALCSLVSQSVMYINNQLQRGNYFSDRSHDVGLCMIISLQVHVT